MNNPYYDHRETNKLIYLTVILEVVGYEQQTQGAVSAVEEEVGAKIKTS